MKTKTLALTSGTRIGNRASDVARMPAVRRALLKRQRAFRRAKGLVGDGRDMGTVVFPQYFEVFSGITR